MQAIKSEISNFIHSPQFWKWHGLALSVFWLVGSSIGIYLKKKSIKLHLLPFLIVDYGSLFFMGAAIYLLLPRLKNILDWQLAEQVHVVLGIIFLALMTFQHIEGAITWHKEYRNYRHRSLGQKVAIMGRIVATIGWIIHQQNKYYAIGVAAASIALYLFVQRQQWSKIKVN